MRGTEAIYSARFSAEERTSKDALWRVLCGSFLQRYIAEHDRVLDLGAGYCEFINNVRCGSKYAVDISEDVGRFANQDVVVYRANSTDLSMFQDGSLDVVFCSNFFEHMRSKDAVLDTLSEVYRVLRPGGKLIIIQPNIKYLYKEYWDFFDHRVALSHLSMAEALVSCGFFIQTLRARFLPYTTKSRLPKAPVLLGIYLRLRPLQLLFGKQMFIVALKREGGEG